MQQLNTIAASTIWGAFKFASFVLKWLPLQWIHFLGSVLGFFLLTFGFRKNIVAENLETAFRDKLTPSEKHQFLKNHYHHLGILFFELIRNLSLTTDEIQRESHWEGLENLDQALSLKKGVILIGSHSANWEFGLKSLGSAGYPYTVVVKRIKGTISQILVEKQRKQFGGDVIYPDQSTGGTLKKMLSLLQENKIVLIIMDQHAPGHEGVRVNFFGAPASTLKVLSKIVQKTSTPVLPVMTERLTDGSHQITIEKPIPYLESQSPDLKSKKEEEEFLNTQNYTLALEELIQKNPTQWLWIHRRWKADQTPITPINKS